MILIMYGTNSVMVVVGLKRDRNMGGRSPLSEVLISSLAVLATYAFYQLGLLCLYQIYSPRSPTWAIRRVWCYWQVKPYEYTKVRSHNS